MRAFLVVLCASAALAVDPLTVDPDKGAAGLPSQLQGTDLTMKFCSTPDKECKDADISSKFAPSATQCQSRCGRDPKCMSAFYDAKKKCHLRKKRCLSTGELADSAGGLDLYRLKHGEDCPADRPNYLTTITEYSNRFCVIREKACKGNDLYKKPQKIGTILDCLKKCAGIKECASVDFKPQVCALKGYQCSDGELVDADVDNYMRLDVNTMLCAENREVPDETLEPQPTAAPEPEPPTAPPVKNDDTCKDSVRAEGYVTGGRVQNIAACDKRYQITKLEDAHAVCERNGLVIASEAQLNEAWKNGLAICRCGWLDNGLVKWPMGAETTGGCGKANTINNCPASAMGSWGGPGWNVFCYKEQACDEDVIKAEKTIGGGTVMNIAKCGLRYQLRTRTQADEVCARNGAVLATEEQMTEAWKAGLSVCQCGWLSNGGVKWPMVGAAGPGCGKGDAINDCPSWAMGSWGGPGWNAFCFKSCDDVIESTQEINSGTVINVSQCGLRYKVTSLAAAESLCIVNGGHVASPAELTAAHQAGMSICMCGWLSNGSSKFPTGPNTVAGCGAANTINECPASAMGTWGGPGWNAFCIRCQDKVVAEKAITGGTIQNVQKCGESYKVTSIQEANVLCKRNGAVLATNAQLEEAFGKGYSVCACGWLSNAKARFPMVGPAIPGCGATNTINECPASAMGIWGGGPGWNAYCFKPCDNDVIVAEKAITGGTIQNVQQCGESYKVTSLHQANVLCKRNGAVVASNAQLEEAFGKGYSVCACGWLSNAKARFPMVGPAVPGCGATNTINECPASAMGIWGGGPGWNAYCFKHD